MPDAHDDSVPKPTSPDRIPKLAVAALLLAAFAPVVYLFSILWAPAPPTGSVLDLDISTLTVIQPEDSSPRIVGKIRNPTDLPTPVDSVFVIFVDDDVIMSDTGVAIDTTIPPHDEVPVDCRIPGRAYVPEGWEANIGVKTRGVSTPVLGELSERAVPNSPREPRTPTGPELDPDG